MNAVGLWLCPCKFTACRGAPQPVTFACTMCLQPLRPADTDAETKREPVMEVDTASREVPQQEASLGEVTLTRKEKAYCQWYRYAPPGATRIREEQEAMYCHCDCEGCQEIDLHVYSQCWNIREEH